MHVSKYNLSKSQRRWENSNFDACLKMWTRAFRLCFVHLETAQAHKHKPIAHIYHYIDIYTLHCTVCCWQILLLCPANPSNTSSHSISSIATCRPIQCLLVFDDIMIIRDRFQSTTTYIIIIHCLVDSTRFHCIAYINNKIISNTNFIPIFGLLASK